MEKTLKQDEIDALFQAARAKKNAAATDGRPGCSPTASPAPARSATSR